MIFRCLWLFFLLISGAGVHAARAAPLDSGAILQQLDREKQSRRSIAPFPKPAEPQPVNAEAGAFTVLISAVQFRNNLNVSSSELQAWFARYMGRTYTFSGLEQLAGQVGEKYRSEGLWAKGVLPEQSLKDGLLVIDVVEGKLGDVQIEHKESPLNFSEARAYEFARSGQVNGGVFSIRAFQRAIKTLDAVPGVTASAVLKPGTQMGYTDVVVRMANTPLQSGSVRLDNHASRATSSGGLRGSAYVNLDGSFRQGEQFNLQFVHSRGTDVLTLGATMPFDSDGARWGSDATLLRYKLGEPLTAFGGHGDSRVNNIFFDQPFRNDDTATIRARLNYATKEFSNQFSGQTYSQKSLQSLTTSILASWPDQVGGGATNVMSASLTLGSLDVNGFADDAGSSGAFKKLNLLFNRAQYITDQDEIFLAMTGQYSRNNLDSSEKMSLGGPTGIRAYPVGEASGDLGLIATVEWRRQIAEDVQGVLFWDHGVVTQDAMPYAGQASPRRLQLRGAGVGVKWQLSEGLEFFAQVSSRIGTNPAADGAGLDTDGSKRDPRAWFSLVKQF